VARPLPRRVVVPIARVHDVGDDVRPRRPRRPNAPRSLRLRPRGGSFARRRSTTKTRSRRLASPPRSAPRGTRTDPPRRRAPPRAPRAPRPPSLSRAPPPPRVGTSSS
jgi:hypothetical protein